ncbi:MAG: zinc metalloprotease HtpX [Candidatus Buchananbacteria bacterium RIFCSPLOWO2_02_FULL_46_11b]|uniref:Protease HtpX homolog n=1 Tax=Candidatus Buchananbacteria bacterium RIFCSPLOWO2_02_FULL_46_11b TaxID=1797548 RepID=A0A1G1YYN0_9BACT|nr:MAG: zinc metalloprotease HtpX [Candidatus Buchananbacteria bacterium RIFCSPLOWO2_02_FULL_46_11b]
MYNQIDSNKRKTIILVVIFTLVILLVGWTFGQLTEAGYSGLALAAMISIVMALFSYFGGDKVALLTAGAKGPITEEENKYVYHLVENLCLTGGLPMPKIYLINDPAINAFACGRNPKHASIALTAGAIEKLKNEELEGVIAHELSHIKNYDILLMTVVIVLIGIIALLSDWFLRFRLFGGKSDNNKGGGQLQLILLVAGIVLLIISPLIGELIKLAISRKREFLADAAGSLLTRYPEGLALALEKIGQENRPLNRANNATAHLYIANPFGGGRHLLSKLFATHPPVEERIAALRKMA